METNLNKLLKRQIKRHIGSIDNLPIELKSVFNDINDTYNNFDNDTVLIQNSIEISSQELRDAFQKQKEDAIAQKETIQKIKDAIAAFNSEEHNINMESEVDSLSSNNLFDSLIRLIEERKQATEALKVSEIKYSKVVENIKEVIFQTDVDGLWIFLNKAWEEITGFSVQESLGELFLNYVHPDDRQRNMELFEPLIMRKKDYCRHQIRYLTKDGGFRWIEVFARLGLDENDEIIGTYGTLQDITENKNAEEALLQSSKKWEAIISASPDGIGMASLDGRLQLMSDKLAAMYGYTVQQRDEYVGKSFFDFIDPSNHDLLRSNIANTLNKVDSRKITEYLAIRKDNSRFYVDVNSSILYDDKGNPESIVFIERDITERKQVEEKLKTSEENFRTFFDSIADLLFVLDGNGNMIDVNETVIKRLEYSKKELLGQSVLVVHPEDRREEAGAIVGEMLAGIKDFCPVPVISKNGVEIQVETRVYPGTWDGEPALFGVVKDVTKIKQSEEKFSKAFQSGSNLMAISTINTGRYIDVNDMFLRTLGYTRDEVIGYTSQELKLFDDIHQRDIVKKSIAENGLAKDFEVKIRTKTGEELIGLFSASYINVGEEPCWLTTMTDITERKKAEKEMQKSETLLRSIMDTTTDVIFVKDRDCRFVYINPAGCKLNGKTQEQLIGHSKADYMTNLEELAKFMADDMRIIEGGNTETFEEQIFGADGKLYTFHTTKVPRYDGQGNIIGLLGVAHDITERKQTEKDMIELSTRLSLATHAGGVGVWDYDLVNNILLWDDQMFALYGFLSESSGGAYEVWKSGLHPDDAERSDSELQMAISAEKDFDTEFRVVWLDGSIHTIKAQAIVQRDNAGKALRMVGTNWDITEKKINEERLMKAVEAADTANKAKSEFLANMSHEIRTPLNGVIGFTDLLRHTPLSNVQEQYVKNANASGHALLGIINDILDFSKIEAGMLELDIHQTDMIELFGHSVDIIKYAADKKNLEVLLNLDTNLPRFAYVDSVRLKQILANLLGNAVKFTEKGEIELKVVYQNLNHKKGRFSLSVRDTGIGVSHEQQKKLFKVFSQADSSTTRKFGGTGLGLVISDMIARKMGSKINITSQLGKGTTFSFDIETGIEYGEMMDKTLINSIKRCLIIDDNSQNRLILDHTLTNWGIESISCSNGLDALRILETSEPFDVIISDYHMPYIDGLETIKMIREKLNLSPDNQPIILLHSSSDDADLHKRCDELGVCLRLTKPVKSDELYNYLCQLIKSVKADYSIEEHKEKHFEKDNYATIMIAEDNDFNMILAKAMILRLLPKVQIIEAVNGKEAISLFQKESPDLIFMDIQMPEMNGLEATIKIREMEKGTKIHTPIVALTAEALKEEQEKCINAGMDDYLTKPIDNDLLHKMILKYIDTDIPLK